MLHGDKAAKNSEKAAQRYFQRLTWIKFTFSKNWFREIEKNKYYRSYYSL